MGIIFGIIIVILLIRWPIVVAKHRNHPSYHAILILSWLGLFTLLTWFIALIWAYSVREPEVKPKINNQSRTFRIEGIDIETKTEAVEYVLATSPENAKALAEIKGMKVTKVTE